MSVFNNDAPTVRSSNIELLRIVCMFLVVARHFVGGSGAEQLYDYSHIPTANMLWMQCWGLWGKTSINAFVLITGYFMCTSRLTVRRFLKLFLELMFYSISIYVVFAVCGYETVSVKRLFKVIFHLFCGTNVGFSASFLWFYLGIPFYNILIKNLTKRQILILIGLLLSHFTLSSTFFFNVHAFNHTFWYMTLYFIASYIRLYPMRWMSRNRICVSLLMACVLLAVIEVIVADLAYAHGWVDCVFEYWLVCDSDKILALAIGVLLFLAFRNLTIGYSKIINVIASTTFGVFLIHTSSQAMYKFIWVDTLDVASHYSLPIGQLIAFSFVSVCGVFAVCSLIDYLRIRLIEFPIMNRLFCCKDAPKTLEDSSLPQG